MLIKLIKFSSVLFLLYPFTLFAYVKGYYPDYNADKKQCETEHKNNDETTFCTVFLNGEKKEQLKKTEEDYFLTLKNSYLSNNDDDCPHCKDMASNLIKAEKSWREYVDSACSVVYDRLDGGKYNNVYSGLCYIRLYQEHINNLWYLYMKPFDQNDKPLLPEPELN
ncbi:DUF1311 domain-containing protein [Salmonella enterica subsp. enterica serovar Newport]|nr:DUF1311 domain-containing protein [Salmonella enterica subsp. enterica serovar Newport]